MSPFETNLDTAMDLPVATAPNAPLWIENFWWLGFDPAARAGVMMHMASLPHDFGLVRQTVMVFLPDGSLLVDLAVGRRGSGPGVSSATASVRCEEPFRRWSLTLDGAMERTTTAGMWSGPVPHGPRTPVRFELTSESLGPPWIAHSEQADPANRQDWVSEHYHQPVRLTGAVHVNGAPLPLDCIGVRDHSRGPRNMSGWSGHCLVSAAFPDGRCAGALVVHGPGDPPVLNTCYLLENGVLSHGTVTVAPPRLGPAALQPEAFDLVLRVNDSDHVLQVETAPDGRQRSFLSMLPPNDVVLGLCRDDPSAIGLNWTAGTYHLDGVAGYGPLERSALVSAL